MTLQNHGLIDFSLSGSEIEGKLNQDLQALFRFAANSKVATGFGYLDANGKVNADRPVELWITCRMTYVFSLASMLGYQEYLPLAKHGIFCIKNYFSDPTWGGWYSAIAHTATNGVGEPVNDRKEAYAHAFVLLASNAAACASVEGAAELLDEGLANQNEYWFDKTVGRVRESWNREFTETEDYRGINANMHTTEAYLAVADARDDVELLNRAVGILEFTAARATENDWRIPEHYSSSWEVLPEYNIDQPAHPFRPFGITPGHGLEWARLMLQARASLQRLGLDVPEWMLPSARDLYLRAIADGWHADGADGFIYTTDFAGQPVVRQRMHWVWAEAIGAAVVLRKVLAEEGAQLPLQETLSNDLATWSAYGWEHLREDQGLWHHELDAENQVAAVTWDGKPDAYHVVQMLLLPLVPPSPSFAAALRG